MKAHLMEKPGPPKTKLLQKATEGWKEYWIEYTPTAVPGLSFVGTLFLSPGADVKAIEALMNGQSVLDFAWKEVV